MCYNIHNHYKVFISMGNTEIYRLLLAYLITFLNVCYNVHIHCKVFISMVTLKSTMLSSWSAKFFEFSPFFRGAHPMMLSGFYSWHCTQELLPSSTQWSIWDIKDQSQISHVQGRHTMNGTIFSSPSFEF